MLDKFWEDLKCGGAVRGAAEQDGPDGLTDEAVRRVMDGFVLWLSEKAGKAPAQLRVSVGHDPRPSAGRIQRAAVEALRRAGVHVLLCHLVPSPALFSATARLGCAAAVQITGGNGPASRNGLLFFTRAGVPGDSDMEAILQHAQAGDAPAAGEGAVEDADCMAAYSARLRGVLCGGLPAPDGRPLAGLHVVVDAGNGAGGFFAADVLAPLGADLSGSQFLEPDGAFPNHAPDPADGAARASLRRAVKRARADLGILFDTDAGSIGVVDGAGRDISGCRLAALAIAVCLGEHPGATVATDPVMGDGLRAFIEDVCGGRQRRFRCGLRHVAAQARRLNAAGTDCPLAVMADGRAALRENGFLCDGAYLAAKLLAQLVRLRRGGGGLADLLRGLPEPAEWADLRLPVQAEDFQAASAEILQSLRQCASHQPHWRLDPGVCEGVRIRFDARAGDGWAMLRAGTRGHAMPLHIESNLVSGVQLIASQLYVNLRKHKALNVAPVEEYIANY